MRHSFALLCADSDFAYPCLRRKLVRMLGYGHLMKACRRSLSETNRRGQPLRPVALKERQTQKQLVFLLRDLGMHRRFKVRGPRNEGVDEQLIRKRTRLLSRQQLSPRVFSVRAHNQGRRDGVDCCRQCWLLKTRDRRFAAMSYDSETRLGCGQFAALHARPHVHASWEQDT